MFVFFWFVFLFSVLYILCFCIVLFIVFPFVLLFSYFYTSLLPTTIGWKPNCSKKINKYYMFYQGGRCIRLTTIPLSCADFLQIWEP